MGPIDLEPGLPRHRQVYEAIRAAILSGRILPGERLPPTRTLAEQLSLSRATVNEAYAQLRAEGYLQGKHGSGTYVAPDLPREVFGGAERPEPFPARPVALSPWGRRVARGPYRSLLRWAGEEEQRFELRPHRIAQDQFPWDAWRSSVDRALTENRAELLSYPPSAGHRGLRAAIVDHVGKHRAVRCTPDEVVIVNGAQQGLNLLSHVLFQAGDRVAVEDPGYPTARLAFESHGMAVTRVPVDGEGMIVDRLHSLPACQLIHVTPSHQDPTGATLSLGRRLALLEIAERMGALVLEDDYDSEFRYEGRPVESLQGLDRTGLVVYAGTFSKSVLPGLRIGFLILPPQLKEPFLAAKALWDGGTPMLEQAALAQFMVSGDFERHIRRMRRLYRARRDALIAALEHYLGDRAAVGERHGGLNLLLTLRVEHSEAEIVLRAREAGVALQGASAYFSSPPPDPTFLLGFAGLPEEDMAEAVGKLAATLPPPTRGRDSAQKAIQGVPL